MSYIVKQENNPYDMNKDVGVMYKYEVDLRVTDILKICGPLSIQQMLGMFKYEPDSDTGYNTRITFNKYENNQFNLDCEATKTFMQYYVAKDNSPHKYRLELYNIDEENRKLLPDYMQDLLPKELCLKAPYFTIPDIEVCNVRTLPEIKRTQINGRYHLLSDIDYTDLWVWTNLEYDLYKDIKMPAKRIHWLPQFNDYDCYTINKDSLINLFKSIATEGMKVEIRIEVGYYGQLVNCVESGHRIVAAKYLGLPTIPAALIFRKQTGYPFISPGVRDEPQNPKVLDLLNSLYNPEIIFNKVDYEEIHRNCGISISGNFNKLREEARECMLEDFPNKIYTSFEDLGFKVNL